MKLHLGAGKRRINLPGWINVDIDPANEPDVVANAHELFWTGSWLGSRMPQNGQGCVADLGYEQPEAIYACHLLEHFNRHSYKDVLRNWFAVLKPGGILRLSVPDLEAVFIRYGWRDAVEKGISKLPELLGFLYGGQRNEHDCHKMGWDFATLKRDLEEAGFKDVHRYDRDKTEHADVDDYSAAYLPHMDRTGQLMSLNVEAVKP